MHLFPCCGAALLKPGKIVITSNATPTHCHFAACCYKCACEPHNLQAFWPSTSMVGASSKIHRYNRTLATSSSRPVSADLLPMSIKLWTVWLGTHTHCAVKLTNLTRIVMRLTSAFGSVPNVTRLRLDWGPFPESAICVNSWAGMNYYGTDWGSKVGGRPERIRWSSLFEVSPFCLVMPKLDAKDGRSEDEFVEVGVHLKSIYMRMLRQDKLFNRFADWRCS